MNGAIDQVEAGSDVALTERTGPLAITEGPGALLSAIIGLAKDPDFDVQKLQALMGMQERLEDRQAERAFAAALHDAQAEIPHIDKNGTVSLGSGKGTYAFATWSDMDKVLRPVMDRHGFTLSFDMTAREGGGAVVAGTLMHVNGHSKTASIPLALDSGPGRNNIQAMGSTMSYGRRYVAEMLFNLVRKDGDDDGVAGGKKYITAEQAEELRALAAIVGQKEGGFLDQLFAGSVRSFEEIEIGTGYLACRSTLEAMKRRNEKRAAANANN